MTAQQTVHGDPFEAALARHLKAGEEPVPPRLAATVDAALRGTLPERRTGWAKGALLRPRLATLSLVTASVAMLAVVGGLALVGMGQSPTPPELLAPAAMQKSPPATSKPAVEADSETTAEAGHWAAGSISLKNDGFRFKLLDRDIGDEAPTSVSGAVTQREAGPLDATLNVVWDATDDAGAVGLLIEANADDGRWSVRSVEGYRPFDFTVPRLRFESPDLDFDGHGLDAAPLGDPIEADVRLRAMSGSLYGTVDPATMPTVDYEGTRLRIDGMRFQAFDDETLATYAPVGRAWDRAEFIIESQVAYPVAGQDVVLKARECVDDYCRGAKGTHWSVDDPSIASVGKDDERTHLKSKMAGSVTVTATASVDHADGPSMLETSRTIEILPTRPSTTDSVPASAVSGSYSIYPTRAVANHRDYVIVTGWRCTESGGAVHGEDGLPGSDDDDCVTVPLTGVDLQPGARVTSLARFGPSAVLTPDAFGRRVPEGIDWSYAGAHLMLEGLDEPLVPELYTARTSAQMSGIDNERWQPALNDVRALLRESGGVPVAQGQTPYHQRLDVNGDGAIDAVDLGLLDAIVRHQNGRYPIGRSVIGTARPTPTPPEELDVDGDGVISDRDLTGLEATLAAAEVPTPEPTPLVLDDGTIIDAELADAIDTLLASVETTEPAATPDPDAGAVALDQVKRLAVLPDGSDPAQLVEDLKGGAIYIDRNDGTVYRANLKNGKVASIVKAGGGASGGKTIGVPSQLATADYVIIVDDRGRPFRWSPSNSAGAGTLAKINLRGRTAFEEDHGDIEAYDPPVGNYRLYVAEPSLNQIMKYTQDFDGSSFAAPGPWLATPSEEVANARQLYIDFDVYTLFDDTLRRYEFGKWDGIFVLDTPPVGERSVELDYRLVDGSGSESSLGRAYVYDAANARIVGFDKNDGSFMRQWMMADGGPELDDVRGMYVIEGGLNSKRTRRKNDQLVWVTPEGIYSSTLRMPPLVDG